MGTNGNGCKCCWIVMLIITDTRFLSNPKLSTNRHGPMSRSTEKKYLDRLDWFQTEADYCFYYCCWYNIVRKPNERTNNNNNNNKMVTIGGQSIKIKLARPNLTEYFICMHNRPKCGGRARQQERQNKSNTNIYDASFSLLCHNQR
ncbi:hypothetical protein BLOT_003023 [Blomia tropicalis]|nr:hypothetical protein BLOT_003023 [Blomia tropicalis]